jgi:hypothetical protein
MQESVQFLTNVTSDQAAILIQARTGHCRLKRYLSRIGVVDEARCSCEFDEETIRHLLLSCPRWTDERRELRQTVGERSGDVPYILGWGPKKDVRTGQFVDGPKEKWKPDMEDIKATKLSGFWKRQAC